MASSRNIEEFKEKVKTLDYINRTEFLFAVKHATIHDTSPWPNTSTTRAVFFAQAICLDPTEKACPHCDAPFELYYKPSKDYWC